MIDTSQETQVIDPSKFIEKPGGKVTKRPDHGTRAIPTDRPENDEAEAVARFKKSQEDATARRIIDEALVEHAVGGDEEIIETSDATNREPISYTIPAPVEQTIKHLEGAELEEVKQEDSFWRKVWNFGQNRFGK